MMGVYRMLATGLAPFCLRYLIPEERWSERAARTSFWSLNIGLAWMCFATLFPLGILQLRAMNPWPHSEAGRFHRGISLAVALMAGLILVAEAARNHAPLELAALGAVLAVVVLAAWHLHAAFRATPANFPMAKVPSPDQIPTDPLRAGYRKSKEDQR